MSKEKTAGTILREYRESKDLTLEQLADQANVSTATVWNIEADKNTSLKTIKKIAKALDIPSAVFMRD